MNETAHVAPDASQNELLNVIATRGRFAQQE
jgi:hypothetical protein